MSTRKSQSKREREAIAEPTTDTTDKTQQARNQASMPQNATDDLRARVWEAYLRGVAKAQIARAESLDRQTVTRIITACYAEIADERKRSNARKLDGAVGRMRRLQEQAWADHDADDERERQVLEMSLAAANTANDANTEGVSPESARKSGVSDRQKGANAANVSIRYQSQRSQYLRIILDAEKEIARLEGLYEGMLDVDGAVAVAFYRIGENSQGAVARLSGANTASLPAPLPSTEGV